VRAARSAAKQMTAAGTVAWIAATCAAVTAPPLAYRSPGACGRGRDVSTMRIVRGMGRCACSTAVSLLARVYRVGVVAVSARPRPTAMSSRSPAMSTHPAPAERTGLHCVARPHFAPARHYS
jgi:hypothetical protein